MKIKTIAYKQKEFERMFLNLVKKPFDGSLYGFLFKIDGIIPPIYPKSVINVVSYNATRTSSKELKKIHLYYWKKSFYDLYNVLFVTRPVIDETYKRFYNLASSISCGDWSVVTLEKDYLQYYSRDFNVTDLFDYLKSKPWYGGRIESILPKQKYAWFSTEDNIILFNIKAGSFELSFKVPMLYNSDYGNYVSTAHIYNGFKSTESLKRFAWTVYNKFQNGAILDNDTSFLRLDEKSFHNLFDPSKESEIEKLVLEHELLNQTATE